MRPFNLGWHPVEPEPGPRSALLDQPPSPAQGSIVASHAQWRADVEADEARILRAHPSGPFWHPVPLSDAVDVLPIYGGTAMAVEQVVTTLVTSGMESGLASSRVVNLSGWDLTGSLREQMRRAKRNRVQFEQVSTRGSTVNLFGNPKSSELVALLVDAVRISADRSAGRKSQQERQELEQVVRLLRGSVTLDRIIDAVDAALGGNGAQGQLSVDELRDLRDYHDSVVDRRRATSERLTDLLADLGALQGFTRTPGLVPEVVGTGKLAVRWFDVASGSSTDEVELGRQLVARAVLQTFTLPGQAEMLVVVGAERLSGEVLDEMVTSAQRLHKRLVLLYTQINDGGQRMLGYSGSSVALFLRMPNSGDATIAAEYLGREYKFVVNGISIAEGQTEDWSNAIGTSQSQGRSRSTSTTSSKGIGGGALNFGRSIGSTVSRSFEAGISTTQSSGTSTSRTSTTSTGRVHEYVVEPDVFMRMPEDVMLIVGDNTVTIASCDNSLRWSKQASTSTFMALP